MTHLGVSQRELNPNTQDLCKNQLKPAQRAQTANEKQHKQ
jgi:hypothetical protein